MEWLFDLVFALPLFSFGITSSSSWLFDLVFALPLFSFY